MHRVFGTSFPVRFDYLDTVDGGNLSVHCHPQEDYMRSVFGWPYTQHESYYVMVGSEGQRVFLGLREEADVNAFYQEASKPTTTVRHWKLPATCRPSRPRPTNCS